MQDFTKPFKLESKNKQLEFNIPHRKKNIFLRYPRTGFIVGLLVISALAFLLRGVVVPNVALGSISAFMAFLWLVEKIVADEKVFSGPTFLLSVLIIFAVRVFLNDMLPPEMPANMFLFSLICFSIVFIFKVKKAIATGKLKWNQGGYNYTHNFSHDAFLKELHSPNYLTDPAYSSLSSNIYYRHRSPLDS